MSDDIKVGDTVVCVNDDFIVPPGFRDRSAPTSWLERGKTYVVLSVLHLTDGVYISSMDGKSVEFAIQLQDMPTTCRFDIRRFRKQPPEKDTMHRSIAKQIEAWKRLAANPYEKADLDLVDI